MPKPGSGAFLRNFFILKERDLLVEAKVQKEAMERRREAEQEVSILERARRDAKIEEEKKRTAKLVSTLSWLVVHFDMTSKLY